MKRSERRRKYFAEVKKKTDLIRSEIPGREYGHTLDHVLSVRYGFNHDIPASLIASHRNLKWMHFNENIQKGSRMTTGAIFNLRRWGYTDLADIETAKLKR